MRIVTLVARILLGLIFFVFGLNGFLQFVPVPPGLPANVVAFTSLLMSTHYIYLTAGVQAGRVGGDDCQHPHLPHYDDAADVGSHAAAGRHPMVSRGMAVTRELRRHTGCENVKRQRQREIRREAAANATASWFSGLRLVFRRWIDREAGRIAGRNRRIR